MTLLARLAFAVGTLGVIVLVVGVVGPLLRLFTFSPAPVVPIAALAVPVAFTFAYALREVRDLRRRRAADGARGRGAASSSR